MPTSIRACTFPLTPPVNLLHSFGRVTGGTERADARRYPRRGPTDAHSHFYAVRVLVLLHALIHSLALSIAGTRPARFLRSRRFFHCAAIILLSEGKAPFPSLARPLPFASPLLLPRTASSAASPSARRSRREPTNPAEPRLGAATERTGTGVSAGASRTGVRVNKQRRVVWSDGDRDSE